MNKYLIKLFKRDAFINAFLILQTVAVMFGTCICISSVMSRIEYYLPLKSILASEGECVVTDGKKMVPECLSYIRDYTTEEIKNESNYIKEIYSTNIVDLGGRIDKCVSYSDNMSRLFRPQMESGVWLGEMVPDKELYAVASYSTKLKTGDTIKLVNSYEKIIAVKICGVLSPDAKVISSSPVSDGFDDFRDIYEESCASVLYFSSEDIENFNIEQIPYGITFVTYKGKLNKDIKTQLHRKLYCYGSNFKLREELRKNSLKYINEDLVLVLPITICLLFMLLICSCVSSVVSIKKNYKMFFSFFLCGAQKRNIILLLLQKELVIGLIGMLVNLTLAKIISSRIKAMFFVSTNIFTMFFLCMIVLINVLLNWLIAEGIFRKET